ncbi:MAG: 2OG-Fe(II) oxygenase [Acidobacteriia bacterium]|nr:2OG-Fe(II) oxygenase [Terriglobia bacterium]
MKLMAAFDDLRAHGYQRLGIILTRPDCEHLRNLYNDSSHFRGRIEMARYRFGKGEYQYFGYPLPALVAKWRARLYRELAPLASEWMAELRIPAEYPTAHAGFLKVCHASGQQRPTPLLLRYRAGDYNALHQDLYGPVVFPFQVIVCLSQPEKEFTGGELILVEQQPRAQSVGRVVRLAQGEAVVITTRYRPARGSRGFYRTNYRHGVSPVESGERFTLGLIFHDAE